MFSDRSGRRGRERSSTRKYYRALPRPTSRLFRVALIYPRARDERFDHYSIASGHKRAENINATQTFSRGV